jgi:hypothetical protein
MRIRKCVMSSAHCDPPIRLPYQSATGSQPAVIRAAAAYLGGSGGASPTLVVQGCALAQGAPLCPLLLRASHPTSRKRRCSCLAPLRPSRRHCQSLTPLPRSCSAPRCRSNPIAHPVRRKRQRLPPSLIEDPSGRDPCPAPRVCVGYPGFSFVLVRLLR